LEELIDNGWDYHDTESQRLARELEAAAENGVTPPALLPSFLHLATHTIGEHLGDWQRAVTLGKQLLDGQEPVAETAKAWARLYVASVLAGDLAEAAHAELTYLQAASDNDDLGPALLDTRFMLVAALVGTKQTAAAARIYRKALDLARRFPQSAPLNRTIAATSNNLGWELYEMPSRTADEDNLMQLCAETSFEYWLECGNWINEERALYLKAVVTTATGDPETGLAHADKALAVINAHGERPFDTALLHLARASSLAILGDGTGSSRAIDDADTVASKLTAPDLKAQFAAARAKTIAASHERP
jgi:tetratricopeptide (TPR) repeat protein